VIGDRVEPGSLASRACGADVSCDMSFPLWWSRASPYHRRARPPETLPGCAVSAAPGASRSVHTSCHGVSQIWLAIRWFARSQEACGVGTLRYFAVSRVRKRSIRSEP